LLTIDRNGLQMKLKNITVFHYKKVRKLMHGIRVTRRMASLLVLLGFQPGTLARLLGLSPSSSCQYSWLV
jgi:hypothetical protein